MCEESLEDIIKQNMSNMHAPYVRWSTARCRPLRKSPHLHEEIKSQWYWPVTWLDGLSKCCKAPWVESTEETKTDFERKHNRIDHEMFCGSAPKRTQIKTHRCTLFQDGVIMASLEIMCELQSQARLSLLPIIIGHDLQHLTLHWQTVGTNQLLYRYTLSMADCKKYLYPLSGILE